VAGQPVAGFPAAPRRRKKLFGRRKRATVEEGESIWDTKLILIGGGTLLGMLILLGILIWAFTRESGDEMFAIADEFYRQGSYTKAIHNYDRYLEKAPNHPQVGLARVRRGLARIRQITETKKDWGQALKTAKEVLPEIAQEKESAGEGRPDLRSLLPQIAQGLAQEAQEKLDPRRVAQSREALALVHKYIPTAQRPRTQLREIEALLALTEREIAQGEELQKALQAMAKATAAGEANRAYAIRAKLLKQYPALVNNPKLREATVKISEALGSVVKWIDRPLAAVTDGSEAEAAPALALAQRQRRSDVAGVEGHVIFALAAQAAYGLDAETGKLLWRRPVGFATDGRTLRFPPTPLGPAPGSDAVLVDHKRQEVLRVEAATGKIRWRLEVGEPFDAHPVVTEDRIWLATRLGKLLVIDPATGNCRGYTELPQPLRVGPTIDGRRGRVYQVADHSNLYVLSLADGRCQDVVYLGHQRGTITTPPVVVSRFLLVAENDGAEEATLRVLSLEATGEGPPIRPLQEVALRGHVDTPPVVSGVRLLVVTDVGEVYVFEITGAAKDKPLMLVATGKAGRAETPEEQAAAGTMVRYALIRGGRAWVADNQLTRFDIHAARGRLQPRGVENDRSATLQPPAAVGQAVFH
ncbi:MAG TPA: hypothetical protein EYP56_01145, partial [Planctomycetaceae bacterium]|nr:hypothetical protein [Planctomycetaceae bacterium]